MGFVVAQFLSLVTTLSWLGLTGADADERSLGVAVAALSGLWLGFGGTVVLAARRKGSGRIVDDFGVRMRPRDVPVGIAAGLLAQVLIALLYLPFPVDDLGKENDRLVDATHGVGLVVLYLLLAVGAPVVEELFFRGLMQRSLVRRFGPAWGIGVTAVVFGLTHFSLAAVPGLVVFGVVLGVLAHRTGRLGSAIVAHVAFNALAVGVYLGN